MIKPKDITGERFGKLVARYVCGKDKRGNYLWFCDCDCGGSIIAKGSLLKDRKNPACKKCTKEQMKNIVKENGYKNKKYNTYDLSGEYGIGYTRKGEEFYFDLEDYDKIKDYCWFCEKNNKDNYIIYNQYPENIFIRMHILVMKEEIKKFEKENPNIYYEIDHDNKIKYDNRKSNLRFSTRKENSRNGGIRSNSTSGFLGVHWLKNKNKWLAHITINYKFKSLGRFKNKEDAIKARLKAEKEYFKDFAPQKYLFEQYNIV